MNLICIQVFVIGVGVLCSLPQIKADFNFRVPSLGCPDYFTDALIEAINRLRSEEAGDEFPPLSKDLNILAFEAKAWAATNRYLGNRRPEERRYGQNYWYWPGDPSRRSFRLSIQDFVASRYHFRPSIWKRNSEGGGWSWRPYSREEWAATTRVGVGCLTDYNSFAGGEAQVFVSLFYDYEDSSEGGGGANGGGGGGGGGGRGGGRGSYKTTKVQEYQNPRPTRQLQPHTFAPRTISPTTKRHAILRTTQPAPPPPFTYPDDIFHPTFKKLTKRPRLPKTTHRIRPSRTPVTQTPPKPSTKGCSHLLQTASQPMSFAIPSTSCPPTFSKSIFCLLNENRQKESLPPLSLISSDLSAEAANWTATKRAYGELWSGERRFGQTSFTIVDPKGLSVIRLKPERLVSRSSHFRPKIWSGQQETFVGMEDASWAKTAQLGVGCTGFKNETGSVLFVVFFFDNADFSHGYE